MPIEYEKVSDKIEKPVKTEKEKILEDIEVLKLKKEQEAHKLDLASFAEFAKLRINLELKETELLKSENTIQEREKMIEERERQVVAAGERNEAVKNNLVAHEIQDYKKAEAVRAFAFQTYFAAWDNLMAKIYNAKALPDCIGLVKKGKKMVDEACVIDVVFRDELLDIMKPIQTVLKKSPRFHSDTGEYLTEDEVMDDEDDELDEEAE